MTAYINMIPFRRVDNLKSMFISHKEHFLKSQLIAFENFSVFIYFIL